MSNEMKKRIGMIAAIAVMLVLLGLLLFYENKGDEQTASETTTQQIEVVTTEQKTTEAVTDTEQTEDETDQTETVTEDESDTEQTEATTEPETDKTEDETETADSDELYYRYSIIEIQKLSGTKIFTKKAIEHIFKGSNGGGYHYEGIKDTPGKADPDSRSKPDDSGVYTAKVTINGSNKKGNGGYSSFFPIELSPQEVIDAITEAYNNREHVSGNTYEGVSDSGIVIDMYLTDDDKIISAFPIYDD